MKKVVLITGASSGIGLEMAKVFAAQGHDLVLVARREENLKTLADMLRQSHQVDVRVEARDLSLEEACEGLYETLQADGIFVETLVNNAGLGTIGPFATQDWRQKKQMLAVNIDALTLLSDLFVNDMIAQGSGHILNVASTAAFQPGPGFAVYCATKAYVLSLSEAMAEELASRGVHVMALCPGMTESEFFDVAGVGDSPLLEKIKLPSSQQVAEFAYEAIQRKRRVAIHGKVNWLAANMTRLAPRRLVTKISAKIFSQA